jgi:hypothetical protein
MSKDEAMLPEEALDFGRDLLDDLAIIREKVEDGDLPSGAEEFVEDVEGKVEGIVEWIDENSHVTEKQEAALRGIRGGADRWLGRDR